MMPTINDECVKWNLGKAFVLLNDDGIGHDTL